MQSAGGCADRKRFGGRIDVAGQHRRLQVFQTTNCQQSGNCGNYAQKRQFRWKTQNQGHCFKGGKA